MVQLEQDGIGRRIIATIKEQIHSGAYRPGDRTRLLYRLMVHKGRKGEPKGFREEHFAALLEAAHQQLGGPIVVVWAVFRLRASGLGW